MTSHLLNSLPGLAALWTVAPGFVDSGLFALVVVGALLGITSATEPEDPTDF